MFAKSILILRHKKRISFPILFFVSILFFSISFSFLLNNYSSLKSYLLPKKKALAAPVSKEEIISTTTQEAPVTVKKVACKPVDQSAFKFVFKKEAQSAETNKINDFYSSLGDVSFRQSIVNHFSIFLKNKINKLPRDKQLLFSRAWNKISANFTIDKSGDITRILLFRFTGIDEIDDFFKSTINEAAPYPSIPSYLNKESFSIDL